MTSAGDIFVSIPRWKLNVPATLCRLASDETTPLLAPYPSWDLNSIGHSDALQSVLGFELDDAKQQLWVLDQGRVAGNVAAENSIKLVIYDLATDATVRFFVFPEEVAPRHDSFLNDLVIDKKHNFAYITDSGVPIDANATDTTGALIVYDFEKNQARRIFSQERTAQQDPSVWLEINGEKVLHESRMLTGADGIALSPDTGLLYWCPLTSRTLYAIETKYLRDFSLSESQLVAQILVVGNKISGSDGLAAAANGLVFMTMLEQSAIKYFNPKHVTLKKLSQSTPPYPDIPMQELVSDAQTMVWPDTIGFDHHKSLVFTTNHLNHFVVDNMTFNPSTPNVNFNYRVWSVFIDSNSYMETSSPSPDSTNPVIIWTIIIFCGILAAVSIAFYLKRFNNDSSS